MRIDIELSDAQTQKLRSEAQLLGISPSELAAAAVSDLLDRDDTDIESAVERVLRNREDAEDLEIAEQRRGEPLLSFEEVTADLRRRGRI